MALVHSRIGRVFFYKQNVEWGGCGGKYNINSHPKINHHYEAYQYCTQ